MHFSLLISNRWAGDFQSPLSGFSYNFYCVRCGEIFARRIEVEGKTVWHSIPGECMSCRKMESEYQSFLLPGETLRLWEPKQILAEEFLFNSGVYKHDRNPTA